MTGGLQASSSGPQIVKIELSPSPSLAAPIDMATPEPNPSVAATPELATSPAESGEPEQASSPRREEEGTPAGTGPLYKCAICGEYVYESQLEHHVNVCPDPAEMSPDSTAAKIEEAAGRVSARAPDKALQAVPLETMPDLAEDPGPYGGAYDIGMDLASEETVRMWSQWKDSELAAHHNAMIQRQSLRRTQIKADMRKKEAQECTFAPKTLPRGSPRTCSRPDSTGEGKWIQRWDQRMRNQRLKQVEADHYAELTLKPQISPFAKAWSQKQAEVLTDGQAPVSVFERLYQAAIVQEDKRELALREKSASEEAELSASMHSSSVSRPPARRHLPTSELLYNDALDRRERLRIMAEQLEQRRADESKQKRQVLNRSRRYYWSMLERQIHAAFQQTTGNQKAMLQSSLEEFLVRFQCTRPRRADGQALSPQEEVEASRLRSTLWRHLDPLKTGHTDLLTLTVFFHVLMGVVDEATRAIKRGSTEDPASPGAPAGEGSPGLEAIYEEAGQAAELGHGAAGAGVCEDDEGRRITELLLRFDATRLRSELQPLYVHRMHYQSQQEKKEPDDAQAFKFEIDSQSRVMAAKLTERQRGESGKDLPTHADVLHWRYSQTQEKKEQARIQAKVDEAISCTFRPKTTSPRELYVDITTPPGASRAEVLYARGLAEKERRDAKVVENERMQKTAETRDCTFRPCTADSKKSYHKAHDGQAQAPVPRGFYETRQRLRAANEIRGQRLQQQEDRLGRCEPPGAHKAHPTSSSATSSVPSSPGAHGRLSNSPGSGEVSSSGLPTVAEDLPPGSARRSVSPKLAWGQPGSNTRQRSAGAGTSPRGPLAAGGNRGNPGGIRGTSAGAQRTRSGPPGRAGRTPPQGAQDPAANSGAVAPSGGANDVSEALPPALEVPAPAVAEAVEIQEVVPAVDDSPKPAPAPMLYVDVNIGPSQPPERIVLHEGQSVNEVAAEFAAKHVLTPVLAQRLHALLKEVVQRQGQAVQ